MGFGTYEGHAIPTVTVVGQDKESSSARVVVEPGNESLHVVHVSHDSMIWQFEGAVDRVARVVLVSTQGASGASGGALTGIAKEKVSFTSAPCMPFFHDADSIEAARVRGEITRRLGRAPDVFLGAYTTTTMRLPSGRVDAPAPRR